MAISFVGSATGLVAATDTTVAFSALVDASGATPTVLQNDIVIVTVSRRSAGASTPAITTTGYASIYASVFANSTDDTNLIAFFKVMGATPDTSVVITTSGSTNVQSYCVHVLRGVDTTTPFDGVTPTTSTGIGAGSPNAPAITPATAGAWIMACGGAAGPNTAGQTTVLTNPANLDATTNFFRSTAGTRTSTGAGIFSGWTSGSFDPATFGGGAQNASGSFAAATFAIRPAATGGTTYNDTISESVTPADASASAATFGAALSEGITAADTSASLATFVSAISESVAVADASSSTAIFASALSESAITSDSMTGGLLLAASLSETVTPADASVVNSTFSSALAEAVTPADASVTHATFASALTETVAASDNAGAVAQFASILTETFALADAVVGDIAVAHKQYPLAGVPQSHPLTAAQHRPLEGVAQSYPLGRAA